jgi:ABC-type nitrate/sulfonate/bicarbonate transport system substrate-binding protein
MIRILSVVAVLAVALLALAGCGADGEPVQPSANLNVGIGPNGVNTGATVGLTRGPLRVGVGLF